MDNDRRLEKLERQVGAADDTGQTQTETLNSFDNDLSRTMRMYFYGDPDKHSVVGGQHGLHLAQLAFDSYQMNESGLDHDTQVKEKIAWKLQLFHDWGDPEWGHIIRNLPDEERAGISATFSEWWAAIVETIPPEKQEQANSCRWGMRHE